jgi:hypothetical protein
VQVDFILAVAFKLLPYLLHCAIPQKKPTMNCRKLFFLAAASFFISHVSFAQQNNVIEVIASDTIELKPLEFDYQVGIGEQNNLRYMIGKQEPETTVLATPADLRALLSKNNFPFEEVTPNLYVVNTNQKNDLAFVVKLHSLGELKRFYNSVQSLKGINGMIKDIQYESIELYKNEMYKSLYAKAAEDAKLMANAAGKSIGSVISIEELKGPLDNLGLGDLWSEIFNKNPLSAMLGLSPTLDKRVIRKMVFKFQLI